MKTALPQSRAAAIMIAALIASSAVSGCAEPSNGTAGGNAETPDQAPAAPASHANDAHPAAKRRRHANSSARRLLAKLKTAPESHRATYDRDFFPLWDEQRGCNTRQDVLLSETRRGHDQSCSVAHGLWYSAYDGRTTTDPSRFDIDHVVPLAQAWASGAWRWSAGTRERYANDLGYAGSLRAVSATTNREKGDADPSAWMPPRESFRCKYIGTWIAVKYRWRLSVDAQERAVLSRWVDRCGARATVATPRRARVRVSTRRAQAHRHRQTQRRSGGQSDPRFSTCAQAKAHGYGPYKRGRDREYGWYRDADGDGWDCE